MDQVDRQRRPNPKRVAAGRQNRLKRKRLSDAARAKLRDAALIHRPWEKSTGPRTEAGKARSAANGRVRQIDELSVRQARAEINAILAAHGLRQGHRAEGR